MGWGHGKGQVGRIVGRGWGGVQVRGVWVGEGWQAHVEKANVGGRVQGAGAGGVVVVGIRCWYGEGLGMQAYKVRQKGQCGGIMAGGRRENRRR